MKAVVTLFVFCFVLGVGLALLSPAPVNAIDNPNPNCNTDCSDIVCGDGCEDPDYMHYLCYMTFASPLGCIGPFDCRCRAVGCGGACDIE